MLTALALQDIVPIFLPPLVALAFTQYVLDSKALAGRPLRASLIGRYNGIAYFILAGFPLCQWALGLDWFSVGIFNVCGWVLVATTVTSMMDRAIALFHHPSTE